MISTGLHTNELYRLEDVGEETRIHIPRNGRGEMLARSLKGRCAPDGSWWLTPARADKWRLLFRAGYSARKRFVLGQPVWVYELEGQALSLADAVRKCGVEV